MRNDFNMDFDIPERNNVTKHLKKIIIKISIALVALLFVIFLMIKLFGDSDKGKEVPLIEAENQQIKEMNNIEDGISIENLDMEVYDNITKGHTNNYDDLNVVGNQKFVDSKIKEEKQGIKKEKMAENEENKMNILKAKEEQYTELKAELKNQKLVDNLKKGKDVKPSIKVQIAASTSHESAEKYWEQLALKYSDLFKNKYHFVDFVDLGDKGRFYRLQIGYFNSNESAKEFCKKYISTAKKNDTDCIVIQNN